MAHRPEDTDSGDAPAVNPERELVGTPRWVKVSGLVALLILLLFVVVLLVGGGEHGPGRHAPFGSDSGTPGAPGTHTGPPAGVDHSDEP